MLFLLFSVLSVSLSVTTPAVLQTIVFSFMEIYCHAVCLANVHVYGSLKMDAISSDHVGTMALLLSEMASEAISEHLILKNFLVRKHTPEPSYFCMFNCLCMHTWTPENSGYRPEYELAIYTLH